MKSSDRVVSARVAGEVLWHLGYRPFGSEPSLKVKQALVVLDRPEDPARDELAALFPVYVIALAEGRAPGGLERLRDVVLDGRLDEVARLGAWRAAAREQVSA